MKNIFIPKLIRKTAVYTLLTLILFTSCKKNETGIPAPLKKLPGTIYFQWADEGIFSIDMASGSKSTLLPYNVKRNGWDVSRDNKYLLQITDAPDQDYDASQFTITNLSDRSIVSQYKYYPQGGSIVNASLSPNGKLIAVDPTFKEGIVVTDLQGKRIAHIAAVNDEKVEGNPIWMPDNTVLFKHKDMLLKANSDFTNADIIKKLDFADWGMPAVSPDGKKIAFKASNHIWLMNSDGSDMKQITVSSAVETYPQFSPDSKYLLIGTDYHVTGPFGSIWYLKIIPADGRQYQVDDGSESEGVIPVQLEKQLEAADEAMRWR